jgi:hypothetical protein
MPFCESQKNDQEDTTENPRTSYESVSTYTCVSNAKAMYLKMHGKRDMHKHNGNTAFHFYT